MSRQKRPTLSPDIPPVPEPRTDTLAIKIKPSVMGALIKAAEKHGRPKSTLAAIILENWLMDQGWLK